MRCVGTWSTFPDSTSPNYAVDYAFGTLATPIKPYLGIQEGLPADEWIAVGYPVDIDAGERQQFVRGKEVSTSNNVVEMSNNTMQNGASGGGWIADIKGLGQTVIGVNSFLSGNMFGPFFDSGVGLLYGHMQNLGKGTDCPAPNQ